ncbi:MAG: hypothetical protein U0271_39195 [Polyangiaceae bacterium]
MVDVESGLAESTVALPELATELSTPPTNTTPSQLDALPWKERVALERAMAETDPRYAPKATEGGATLESGNGGALEVSASGARLTTADGLTLEVASIGRGADARLVGQSIPVMDGREVRLDRGDGAVEWWRGLPSGHEHGLTLRERPVGDGPLVVDVKIGGDFHANALSEDGIALSRADGVRVARYEHLFVHDASGATLAARMEAADDEVRIIVADAGAQYPIEIDPLVAPEVAILKLPGWGPQGVGYSVSLSSDGNRALLGAPMANVAQPGPSLFQGGMAAVFVRSGSTWDLESVLGAADPLTEEHFGSAVAISADGSRAVIGAPREAAIGSARVFVRSGSTWTQETKLTGAGTSGDAFGSAVAMSGDGSRIIVGSPGEENLGAARAFIRTGSTWTEEAKLVAATRTNGDLFGTSVAISADGNYAMVGGIQTASSPGFARMFVRTSGWAPAGFTTNGVAAGDQMGAAVALNADGSKAIVGAPNADAAGLDAGSARVFVRSGAAWSEQATLTATGAASTDHFGSSVAMSGDGARVVVGAKDDDTPADVDTGSARVFAFGGTSWTQEATLVPVNPSIGFFGRAVGIDASGARVLGGAGWLTAISATGSAWTFARSGTSWTEETLLWTPYAAQSDGFGISASLASDGSRAVIGVLNGDSSALLDAGTARVFVRAGNTWTEEAMLYPSSGHAGDAFGAAVSMTADGSRVLVGAYGADLGAERYVGTAYVFVRNGSTWTEEASLPFSGSKPHEATYGRAVALSGDGTRAAVGSNEHGIGINTGKVTIFVRTGSTWTQEFAVSGTNTGGTFGNSVAMTNDGSRFIAGSDGSTSGNRVRVFARTGTVWTEETGIPAESAAEGCLGDKVAIAPDGSRALASATCPPLGQFAVPGVVHVYLRTGSTWSAEATLAASDGAPGDDFGGSLALSDDGTLAVIGAPNVDLPGTIDAGNAKLFSRTGSTWTEQLTMVASTPPKSVQFAFSAALSGNGRWALFGIPGAQGTDLSTGTVRVFHIKNDGEPCGSATACDSGFCVDGVCCDLACGNGNASDCMACSTAAGAATNGVCGALSAAVASATTCRPAAGDCDVADVCSPASTSCPMDALASSNTICRASVGDCDFAEHCTGSTANCPADEAVANGTPCGGAPNGLCDLQDTCSGAVGASAICNSNVLAMGTACRASVGECDLTEVCDGVNAQCPNDGARAVGSFCGPPTNGPCDAPDICSGTVGATATCDSVFAPSGTVCRAAAGECDIAEACTGASATCPGDAAKSEGTACGGAPSGACDAQDTCKGTVGTQASCAQNFAALGTVCRAAISDCDASEACSGSSAACPADGAEPAGSPCGSAASDACNGADTCAGAIGASAICQSNEADCGDGNACTNDSCDSVTGCKHDAVDDGTVCPGGVCVAGQCETGGGGAGGEGGSGGSGGAGGSSAGGAGGVGGGAGGQGLGGDDSGGGGGQGDDGAGCACRMHRPANGGGDLPFAFSAAALLLVAARGRRRR